MTTAPKRVIANWVEGTDEEGWDFRVLTDEPNIGELDLVEREECGCEVATYVLTLCGGQATILLTPCRDYLSADCARLRYRAFDDGTSKFKAVAA